MVQNIALLQTEAMANAVDKGWGRMAQYTVIFYELCENVDKAHHTKRGNCDTVL